MHAFRLPSARRLIGPCTAGARAIARVARAGLMALVATAVLLAGAVALRTSDPWFLAEMRLRLFDAYQRMAPRAYEPVPVRVVDIDDASLTRLGQWPWPRRLVARLTDRLRELGAAAIVFDAVFAEADRSSPARLAADWAEAPDLATLLHAASGLPDYDRELAAALARAPTVMGIALVAQPGDDRPRRRPALAVLGPDPAPYLPHFAGAVTGLPMLEQAASGVGSFTVGADADEVVRRVPLLASLDGEVYPSLALEALRVAQGADTIQLRVRGSAEAGRRGQEPGIGALRVGGLDLPIDPDGAVWMHYSRDQPARRIAAWRLLTAAAPSPEDAARISGNIVFIGTSAAGLRDLRATPLDPFAAGVDVHAQLTEQLLTGQSLRRPAWALGAEMTAALACGLLIASTTMAAGAAWGALALAATIGVLGTGSWRAYTAHQLLLDPLFPSACAVAVFLLVAVLAYRRAERQRARVRHAFGHYLAPALVEQLVAHPERLKLSGEERELTLLFTDIAGFTAFAETAEAPTLVALLNRYLDGLCQIVMEHGGTIDKIVGDAVHAIFNAPLDQPDHAERAVRCALAIDRFATAFCAEPGLLGGGFGATRIGVNTGRAVVGNFGGTGRFDYTAHGDVVNTAARLESANKHLGTRICVAGETARSCTGLTFRPIGRLLLQGKALPVEVLEPGAAENAGAAPAQTYLEAFDLLAAADPAAAEVFRALALVHPEDPLIALHARRLATGEVDTTIRLAAQ